MKHFKFKDVLIGRTSGRARVFVSATWDGEVLRMTGEVIPFRHQYPDVIGQVSSEAWDVNPRLAELWDRWHLNNMRAGCEHQERWFRESPSLRPSFKNNYKGLKFPCPECGYLYGTAWNYETVPETVLQEIHDILSKGDKK